MSKYRAIANFSDLQDGGREYFPGDGYPREGLDASPERIEELSTSNNRQGRPLIEAFDDSPAPDAPSEEEKPKRARKKKAP